VAGVTGTLSGSGSNVLASVSLSSLAAAGMATNGQPVTLAQLPAAVLTNASAFATAAQGVAATNAQARVSALETNAVLKNDARYLAALTNGGASINGSPITNGASFTLTGGSGGGISNAVVTRIVTYSTTNPIIELSEGTNAWYWQPPTNVALSPTFAGPGSGWAGSGMLRLVRTNNDNAVSWPTNVAWIVNGTRTTTAPTLNVRNAIVVDYFDGMWGLGLITTNATVVP
jgi:hypothetical protein